MRWILVVALVIGVASCYRVTLCPPNESSVALDGCNVCTCSATGSSYTCTEKKCNSDVIHWSPAPYRRKDFDVLDRACVPGSMYKKECNLCMCTEDESEWCTLINCSKKTGMAKGSENEFRCVPGTIFMRECNTCSCSQDGRTAKCTLKNCPTQDNAVGYSKTDRKCIPGTVFEDDCNRCKCSKDGTSAACTRVLCRPEQKEIEKSPVQACIPKSQFMQECNTCWCSDDGTRFACTRLLCPKKKIKTGIVCTPKSRFWVDCNRCVCREDGESASCSIRTCSGLRSGSSNPLKKIVKEFSSAQKRTPFCLEGTIWDQDCNRCWCSGGLIACTLKMSCRDRPLRHGVECEPGTEWISGCDNCVCTKDGYKSCKRKKTLDGCYPAVLDCALGSRWMRGCNECECTPLGRRSCTANKCRSG